MGTLRAFVPRSRASALSPAWGLLAASAPPLAYNLCTCDAPSLEAWGAGNASLLAKELFTPSRGSRHVRLMASQSKPATHLALKPSLLGELAGLALKQADTKTAEQVLKSAGIQSNKVDGAWSGVSMARYLKLYGLLVAGMPPHNTAAATGQVSPRGDDVTPTLAMFLRFVWLTCSSQAGLGEFLRGVAVYHADAIQAPLPITADVGPVSDDALIQAAMDLDNAANIETLIAELGRSACAQIPVKIRKHAPPGGHKVSDCVEVVVREVITYVLADPVASQLLLSGTVGKLSDRLKRLLQLHENPSTTEETLSAAWFAETQGLPNCEYLCRTDTDGLPFELAPAASTVGVAIAELLGLADVAARRPEDPCAAVLGALQLEASVNTFKYRMPAAEEFRWKEVLSVKSPRLEWRLEATFERLHPLAKVAHHRRPRDWGRVRHALLTPSPRGYDGSSEPGVEVTMPWLFAAALAPDDGLRHAPLTPADAAKAILVSRRTAFCDDWQPLQAATFHSEDTTIDELRAAGVRSVASLSLLAEHLAADPGAPALAAWLASDLPAPDIAAARIDEMRLGVAVRGFPRAREIAMKGRSSLVLEQPTWASLYTHPRATVKLAAKQFLKHQSV
jgi:hypothetical protein